MKRPRRGRARHPVERPCRMPGCQRLTLRPLGYCDHCWEQARRAE